MKHVSQYLIHFVHRYPHLFSKLMRKNKAIDRNIVELSLFEGYQPSLDELERFVLSNEFQYELCEMRKYLHVFQ